ncbi:uncharacterized protein I206_104912 [Kwoniella pini CBS 10737]|uniref:BTB domain-containing protein n=1 Tax=Kwoniella pini CBS 10737 TaxID=1296096 RepID=A0A1B9I879_9TREE|nr:uncharacterized protein I206_02452 [Kwoniella pini CBS 10737]OCF51737.1 hypothetical protein I206_02452 [Kwoniella pini CBS 10737]
MAFTAPDNLSRSLPPTSNLVLSSPPRPSRTTTPNRNSIQRRYDHFAPSSNLHNRSNSASMNLLNSNHSGTSSRWWDPETIQWPVHGLNELNEHIENESDLVSADLPEALGKSVMTSTGNFQLDLVPRHQVSPTKPNITTTPRTLSLYITSRNINTYTSQETSSSAGIFVGITILNPNIGEKYVGTKYIWSNSSEFEFSIDAEYASIELPILSTLIKNYKSLEEEDGFMLCVRIGPKWNIQPGFKIPDLISSTTLNALEKLLDKSTGDIIFICLEHSIIKGNEDDVSIQSRKRTIYTHREILEEKSEYFKDLLNSGFKESDGQARIVVNDIGYNTLYWVLRFLYTNSLIFSENYNVRSSALLDSLNSEETNKLVNSTSITYLENGEWAWYNIPFVYDGKEDDDEIRTMVSASSSSSGTVLSRRSEGVPIPVKQDLQKPRSSRSSDRGQSTQSESTVRRIPLKISLPPIQPRRPTINEESNLKTSPTSKINSNSTKQISPKTLHRSHQGYPLPIQRNELDPDPNPHPTPILEPADPLEIYIAADKYRLDILKGLAKEHLLGKLNQGYCIPLAFATYPYDELHSDILDYIVDHWNQVKSSPEFLKCIHEVRQDVWGENGPLVLHNIYMRL